MKKVNQRFSCFPHLIRKKETKIVKKLNGLLKKLNCREYLHHFGPKNLILTDVSRLSYKREKKILPKHARYGEITNCFF